MSSEAERNELCARFQELADTVRLWQSLTAEAMEQRAPLIDEERGEFLAGYLDPEESWRAISAEAAAAFPGAMSSAVEVLTRLAAALEELTMNHRLLCVVESLCDRLGLAVDALKRQVGQAPSVAVAVDELLRTVDVLTLARKDLCLPGSYPSSSRRTPRPATRDW